MQGALSLAHGAIIQAEALRLALVRAGVHYRALFAWLAVTVQRTSGEELSGCRNAFQTDAAALSDFIHRQLIRDAIGPQLSQTVRCNLPLDVGHTAAGYNVTQHCLACPELPMLQAVIFSQESRACEQAHASEVLPLALQRSAAQCCALHTCRMQHTPPRHQRGTCLLACNLGSTCLACSSCQRRLYWMSPSHEEAMVV